MPTQKRAWARPGVTASLRTALPALLTALIAVGTGCGSTPSTNASQKDAAGTTQRQALSPGWNRIEGGPGTACSDGTDYAFFVRPGNPDKLALYLQGGGACWNLATCDPLLQPSYTINLDGHSPASYDGIFNFSRSDNPLADHTVVFAPYCSADVHIGAAEQSYRRPAEWIERIRAEKGLEAETIPTEFSIQHRGFANMQAVLAWIYEQLPNPTSVFISGSSAGSIPSPYYALLLARHYQKAEIIQLGDGAGGYRQVNHSANPHGSWNTVERLRLDPAFADLTDADFNYEQLYIRANAAAPGVRMHAYDSAEDDVQLRFLNLGGITLPSLLEALTLNQADIRAEDPEFRSFIVGGELHTILARPEFYHYRVGERSVRDWVAAVIAGAQVDSVRCDPCTTAQTSSD